MDENALYATIGRLYTELVNASNIIQNQNNTVNQLQQKVSELELSSASNNSFVINKEATRPTMREDESAPSSLEEINAAN